MHLKPVLASYLKITDVQKYEAEKHSYMSFWVIIKLY